MKQKYTITVAGTELSVLVDGSAEAVETVVARLDHKMREIFLQSPRCSKNEAALLCALDFCSDQIAREDKLSELEARVQKAEREAENLRRAVDNLRREKDELKVQLRREQDLTAATVAAVTGAGKPADRTENTETVESTEESAAEKESDQTTGSTAAESSLLRDKQEVPAERRGKGKRAGRVGNMFDLLTFRDDV